MDDLTFPEEQRLRDAIFPDLLKGRPEWDKPHTEAVVYWMKHLLKFVSLDSKVMITAAYAHDWGYIGLFEGSGTADFDTVQDRKARHMEIGAVRIEQFLRRELSESYSDTQIKRITHLVRVHDKMEQLTDEDELTLMEADTLGALDADRVKSTYSKADNEKYMVEVRERRRSRFIHAEALRVCDILIEKRNAFCD